MYPHVAARVRLQMSLAGVHGDLVLTKHTMVSQFRHPIIKQLPRLDLDTRRKGGMTVSIGSSVGMVVNVWIFRIVCGYMCAFVVECMK